MKKTLTTSLVIMGSTFCYAESDIAAEAVGRQVAEDDLRAAILSIGYASVQFDGCQLSYTVKNDEEGAAFSEATRYLNLESFVGFSEAQIETIETNTGNLFVFAIELSNPPGSGIEILNFIDWLRENYPGVPFPFRVSYVSPSDFETLEFEQFQRITRLGSMNRITYLTPHGRLTEMARGGDGFAYYELGHAQAFRGALLQYALHFDCDMEN